MPSSTTPDRRVLVLGASGMLGHTLLRCFSESAGLRVTGSVRSDAARNLLAPALRPLVRTGVKAEDLGALAGLLDACRPEVVVNCIGIVKQLAGATDPAVAMPINAQFPHRLAELCGSAGARLVHISSDCVFSGRKGGYSELDATDADDLYGRSKALGEVDAPHAVTLRTSIIGPELGSAHGLLAWFLAQRGEVPGYSRAVFSGLPTIELAQVIRDHVMPRPALCGIYQVAAAATTKLELLRLIAECYGHAVALRPEAEPAIDRSLDGSRFAAATGYVAAPWPVLIERMHAHG